MHWKIRALSVCALDVVYFVFLSTDFDLVIRPWFLLTWFFAKSSGFDKKLVKISWLKVCILWFVWVSFFTVLIRRGVMYLIDWLIDVFAVNFHGDLRLLKESWNRENWYRFPSQSCDYLRFWLYFPQILVLIVNFSLPLMQLFFDRFNSRLRSGDPMLQLSTGGEKFIQILHPQMLWLTSMKSSSKEAISE